MSFFENLIKGVAKAKFGAIAGAAVGTLILGPGIGTALGAKLGALAATGSALGLVGLDGLEGADDAVAGAVDTASSGPSTAFGHVAQADVGPDPYGNYPTDIHGNGRVDIHGNSTNRLITGEGPKDIWGRGLRPG